MSVYLDTSLLDLYVTHYLQCLLPAGRWVGRGSECRGLKAVDKDGNSVATMIKKDFMAYVDRSFDKCLVEDWKELSTWRDSHQTSMPCYKLESPLWKILKWLLKFLFLRLYT